MAGDSLRLLPQLHPLLHELVQFAVHVFGRDILHVQDGGEFRNHSHIGWWGELQTFDGALFHLGHGHFHHFIRAGRVCYSQFYQTNA